jgi:hypothetical protein
MVSNHLLSVLFFFGLGGSCLIAGIVTESAPLMYSSGAFSFVGILISCYLLWPRRTPSLQTPSFVAPPRIYRNPAMKKNKSDTNLELMGAAAANTTDDGASNTVNEDAPSV